MRPRRRGRGNGIGPSGVWMGMNPLHRPGSNHLLHRVAAGLGAIVLASACTATSGGASEPTSGTSGAPAPAVATSAPASSPPGLPTAPKDCPVTRPDPAFLAPEPFPQEPPPAYAAAWFGTDALWTMLNVDGEVWADLPPGAEGLGQKTFWWSTKFVEPDPAIAVSGERLDAAGSFRTTGLGTNASADFGRAMLIGIQIPEPGCWRLTGDYRGASLSYVVWAGPIPTN